MSASEKIHFQTNTLTSTPTGRSSKPKGSHRSIWATKNFTEWLRFRTAAQNHNPQQVPNPLPNPPQPGPAGPWPAFHGLIDPRNILQAPNPFQRLVRSGAKRFAKIKKQK